MSRTVAIGDLIMMSRLWHVPLSAPYWGRVRGSAEVADIVAPALGDWKRRTKTNQDSLCLVVTVDG